MVKKQKHEEKSNLCYLVVGPMDFSPTLLSSYKDGIETKIFFIDGGLRHQDALAHALPESSKEAISLGDGDSSQIPMSMKKMDQNVSDLGFFLRSAQQFATPISYHFLGFLGGRLDHLLFNLGELSAFMNPEILKSESLVLMDDCIQFLGSGEHLLVAEGTFSIASLNENKIKIQGECEFECLDWLNLPALSSRGLSNVGFGAVIIESKKPLFIIYH